MIIINSQISLTQLDQIKRLAGFCRRKDGGLPAMYYHLLTTKRGDNSNLLYYRDNRLLGYLSVYLFYENACEISLFVHPKYRRQNIATQLLHKTIPQLKLNEEIEELIFSKPASTNGTWLEKLGFKHHHQECHMEKIILHSIELPANLLNFRTATVQDLPWLSKTDRACFPNSPVSFSSYGRFISIMNDPQSIILIAEYNNLPIAKAHIRWQYQDEALFSDIAVLPEYQGRGFASELLVYCINYAAAQHKKRLGLAVLIDNYKAISLYKKYGFKVNQEIDYWAIRLDKLQEF